MDQDQFPIRILSLFCCEAGCARGYGEIIDCCPEHGIYSHVGRVLADIDLTSWNYKIVHDFNPET